MLKRFPAMVNDCLRIGMETKACEYQAIKDACWPKMREYDVHDSYRVSAMFDASNLLKKRRTDSRRMVVGPPRVRNRYLSAALGVYLDGNELVLPGDIRVLLNSHTLSLLRERGVEVVSATFTEDTCSVVYRKSMQRLVPRGMVAVDLNLDNLTTTDTDGEIEYYDTSRLTEVHELYRRVKGHFRRKDVRVKREIWRKYSRLEWEKKQAILHRVSSSIVRRATAKGQVIVLEDLRGLREMYTRRSLSNADYLSRMNAWPFRQALHQIKYKAEWAGLPVLVIDPQWTSEKCCECEGLMEMSPAKDILVCSVCGNAIDRHLNGAKNILKRGLRSWPGGLARETVTGAASERGPSARVDASHLAGRDE